MCIYWSSLSMSILFICIFVDDLSELKEELYKYLSAS